ncbi:MAG TPA: hypothetical protein VKY85_14365 [Candidatus Angelobacter sp.]|nr:hypothetical protein [Candidatus Angelobacter sp.]
MKFWRVIEISKSARPSPVYLSSAYKLKADAEEHRKVKAQDGKEYELMETEEEA